MNAPAIRASSSALTDSETIAVLQSSLYPGAAVESVKMVLGYCRAAGLDPFQKPVHIVPMWDRASGGMRDVVMPGVNLYRTQAARSGECAGVTEPEFGPDKTENIGGQNITYPLWCRVTVSRRLPTGEIVNFTAREFWLENYAVKGGKEKSIAPNAMWTKRPYGQIAKCAEAQALRKAFPEIASAVTADEMEGKAINADDVVPPARVEVPAELMEAARTEADKGIDAYSYWWKSITKEQRVLLSNEHGGLKNRASEADKARTVEADPFTQEQAGFAAELDAQ